MPDPIRGGTYFYCPWGERLRKLSGFSLVRCAGIGEGYQSSLGSRFRTAKAFRRHWRRYHTQPYQEV